MDHTGRIARHRLGRDDQDVGDGFESDISLQLQRFSSFGEIEPDRLIRTELLLQHEDRDAASIEVFGP